MRGTPARRTILLAALTLATLLALAAPILAGVGRPEDQDILWEAAGPEGLLLTEFGDFQCPHCARFALGILPQLERDLIAPGVIRFEYRHYPFLGPESYRAAEAAECARDQGRFGEYHQTLYVKLAEGKRLDDGTLALAAEETGLEMESFTICLEGGMKRTRVLEDKEYGRGLGIRGTPALFLNGREIQWEGYRDLHRQISEAAQLAGEQTAPSGQR